MEFGSLQKLHIPRIRVNQKAAFSLLQKGPVLTPFGHLWTMARRRNVLGVVSRSCEISQKLYACELRSGANSEDRGNRRGRSAGPFRRLERSSRRAMILSQRVASDASRSAVTEIRVGGEKLGYRALYPEKMRQRRKRKDSFPNKEGDKEKMISTHQTHIGRLGRIASGWKKATGGIFGRYLITTRKEAIRN